MITWCSSTMAPAGGWGMAVARCSSHTLSESLLSRTTLHPNMPTRPRSSWRGVQGGDPGAGLAWLWPWRGWPEYLDLASEPHS